ILANHPGVGVFSLPSANAVSSRRHIELGVKGPGDLVGPAFADLRSGIQQLGGDISDSPPESAE
ncbi:MAG: competence/damage-inducible protein A, partial [Burkholderiaceae bacterium]